MRLRHTGLGEFYGPASLRGRGRLLPGLIRGHRQTSLHHQMTKPRLGSFQNLDSSFISCSPTLGPDPAGCGPRFAFLMAPDPALPSLSRLGWDPDTRLAYTARSLRTCSGFAGLRRAALPVRGKAQPADTQPSLQHSVPTAPSPQTQPAPPSTGP